ncbi:ras GTPase-activating protein-binding protein 2 [Dorcoceras hygrometricum]|uniref:Ras GTPase-activating protein-binding protein 2 n=1 Tax=Dorcoceras hygrometricum TaxID=472368 RepID=A0A2Z7CZT8_9LAMI|nr:ras GTPase-activating protein-binding protein 2 [Dorcoceras hygrometricum]
MVTESGLSAQNVASSFVKQYYALLEISPENVHKFYQESSQLGWAEPDGAMTSVTTLRGIDDKIMSSDYKNLPVHLKYVDTQYSKDGGVIVAVTGVLTGKDNRKKNFSQMFFLAKQERGFYVLNDIFRYADICEPITNIVPDDGKSNQTDQAAPVPNSAPSTTSFCHKSAQTEIEVDNNGNVEEKSSPLVLKESGPINISSEASHEGTNSTLAPVSDIKENAPKVTYASILAKTNHETSPKSVSIPLKADYKTIVSTPKADYKTAISTPRASSPPGNGSSKVSNATNGYGEGRGIYIGNLPYDVTKQAIAEEVKKFGPVRRGVDSIQIRRHEDGFCCGFVEFESPDSARRAVEAHHIYFGEKESYISYKKASNQGNNKGKGRSPPRARFQSNHPRGQDTNRVTSNGRFQNGNHSGFDKGQVTDAQPSRQATERW